MAGYVNVRAYAELNDFLAPESRGLTVRRPFRSHQTVKDILEAMGIPHTEVDLILVNGNAEDFAHRPTPGDRIAVYPMFEALDIGPTARLRPVPLRDPRAAAAARATAPRARTLRAPGWDSSPRRGGGNFAVESHEAGRLSRDSRSARPDADFTAPAHSL